MVVSVIVAFLAAPVLAAPHPGSASGDDAKRVFLQVQPNEGMTSIRPQQRPQTVLRVVRVPIARTSPTEPRVTVPREFPPNVLMLRDRNGNPTVPYVWSTGSFR